MINSKILLSIAAITAAVVMAAAATFAFFSDTETSTDNTFVAGVLDLKIDNESFYNGQVYAGTTWALDDLNGHLFFDFRDVKPGDWGEDTISLHVNDNDAWACLDIDLTSEDDNQTNTCSKKIINYSPEERSFNFWFFSKKHFASGYFEYRLTIKSIIFEVD